MHRLALPLLLAAASCKPAADASSPAADPKAPAVASVASDPGDPSSSGAFRAGKPVPAAVATDPPDRPSAASRLPPELERRRAEGLTAMEEGRWLDAERAFRDVLTAVPGDVASKALLDAAVAARIRSQQRATVELAGVTPVRVPPPPFVYTLVAPVPKAAASGVPVLKKVSEAKNSITDDDAWFTKNGLALPELQVPNRFRNEPGSLPPELPTSFGNEMLIRAIRYADHTILMFGVDFGGARHVLVIDRANRVTALLDFDAWRASPTVLPGDERFVDQEVQWAQAADGVLYVSNFHHTYATSSGGKNAYLSAVEIPSGRLLWRSQPLVCNAHNFLIRGPYVVCGYGFTAEPDYLYVLDRTTGKVLTKTRIASGPSFLIEKDGRLFVRTYDTDYVFELR